MSSATPLASALKATQKVIENNAQQALSLAETLAANATLTRELETTRQQLKQARKILQGGGGGRNGGGRGNGGGYGRGGGKQRWQNGQGNVAQQAGGVRNDGRAQHPHVQFADRRGGQQAGIVMQAGNPHMPGGAGDDQQGAYAYVVTSDSVDNNSTPSASQRQRQHKARGVERQVATAAGLPCDPPAYSEAADMSPERVSTPPAIVAGLQWLEQPSVSSKLT